MAKTTAEKLRVAREVLKPLAQLYVDQKYICEYAKRNDLPYDDRPEFPVSAIFPLALLRDAAMVYAHGMPPSDRIIAYIADMDSKLVELKTELETEIETEEGDLDNDSGIPSETADEPLSADASPALDTGRSAGSSSPQDNP